MCIKFNGYNKTISQMSSVLEWLSSYGINAHNSRYAKYEKLINDFFNNKDLEIFLKNKNLNNFSEIILDKDLYNKTLDKFLIMTESLKEIFEIVIIYKTLQQEENNYLKDRLKKIITGQELLTENTKNESAHARDILFELLIISYFYNLNYKIDFETLTDVVVEKNNIKVFGECKRLSSEKNLQKQLSKAKKQLSRINFKEEEYGLIFVDISNCIFKDIIKKELPNAQIAKELLEFSVNNFIKRNEKLIEEYNNKCINFSLAICFVANIPTWVQDGTLYRNVKIQVIAPEKLSDKKFQRLNEILNGFDLALEKLFI